MPLWEEPGTRQRVYFPVAGNPVGAMMADGLQTSRPGVKEGTTS